MAIYSSLFIATPPPTTSPLDSHRNRSMSIVEASRSGEGLQFGPESKARNDRLRAEQIRIWNAYNILEKYVDYGVKLQSCCT